MGMIRGLGHLCSEERQGELGLVSLGKRRLRENSWWPFNPYGDGGFDRARGDGVRWNGFKLKEGIFRLDLRKTFFMLGVER